MPLLNIHIGSLPIEDPVLKFLLELIIILSAPLLLNKIKVPHLLGLLIAGALVGPNGLNLLSRDSSVVVTGTTGPGLKSIWAISKRIWARALRSRCSHSPYPLFWE